MDSLIVKIYNILSQLSYSFWNSYQGEVIKWLFIVYSLTILFAIILVMRKHPDMWDNSTYGDKRRKTTQRKQEIKVPIEPWELIKAKLKSVNPNDWKIAVIEADKLFDKTLQELGYPGTSMGEKLKDVSEESVQGMLQDIWWAHKLRNNIVHEPGHEITNEESQKAAKIFEEAIGQIKK